MPRSKGCTNRSLNRKCLLLNVNFCRDVFRIHAMVKDFPAAVKGVFFLKTGYLRHSECRDFHTIQILLDWEL